VSPLRFATAVQRGRGNLQAVSDDETFRWIHNFVETKGIPNGKKFRAEAA